MEIPYNVSARPDTGLYNAKLGIWLFLASEVMLFGGLFSGYIFMRMSADPGYWPTGLLNVPVGTMNTIILIGSSVTVILAWAALKMRQWTRYVIYMSITILCAFVFLGVKLLYEWPDKFTHFGVYIKGDAVAKYEANLMPDAHWTAEGEPIRREITGHLHGITLDRGGVHQHMHAKTEEKADKVTPAMLIDLVNTPVRMRAKFDVAHTGKKEDGTTGEIKRDNKIDDVELAQMNAVLAKGSNLDLKRLDLNNDGKLDQAEIYSEFKILDYTLELDATSAEPNADKNKGAAFMPRPRSDKELTIPAADVAFASAFFPRHNTFFSTYFLITGLHGLHVLGGALVFCQMLFFGKKLYLRNPEHMANRVEVAGLFWHFVDLVWIFVFPIFYLL